VDTLTTSYVLRSGGSHIGLREQHTCNNVHMSALPRNGFSAAFPTWSMSYCSFARVWSLHWFFGDLEYQVYDSSCLNDLASNQCSEHPWPVGWPIIAQSARCLSTKSMSLRNSPPHSLASGVSGTEPTPFQDGTFNTLTLQASSEGSWKFRQATHLSFLLTVDTTNTLALAPRTTLPGSTQ